MEQGGFLQQGRLQLRQTVWEVQAAVFYGHHVNIVFHQGANQVVPTHTEKT